MVWLLNSDSKNTYAYPSELIESPVRGLSPQTNKKSVQKWSLETQKLFLKISLQLFQPSFRKN